MSEKIDAGVPSSPNLRIYAASRASVPERPAMWRSLRDKGINVISSWIDEAGPGQTADLGELWARIEREIASADCLVLYAEASDFPLKGALIEVGIALGLSKPVRVVAPGLNFDSPSYRPIGSWIKHPSVEIFKDLRKACDAEPSTPPKPSPQGQPATGTPSAPPIWGMNAESYAGAPPKPSAHTPLEESLILILETLLSHIEDGEVERAGSLIREVLAKLRGEEDHG